MPCKATAERLPDVYALLALVTPCGKFHLLLRVDSFYTIHKFDKKTDLVNFDRYQLCTSEVLDFEEMRSFAQEYFARFGPHGAICTSGISWEYDPKRKANINTRNPGYSMEGFISSSDEEEEEDEEGERSIVVGARRPRIDVEQLELKGYIHKWEGGFIDTHNLQPNMKFYESSSKDEKTLSIGCFVLIQNHKVERERCVFAGTLVLAATKRTTIAKFLVFDKLLLQLGTAYPSNIEGRSESTQDETLRNKIRQEVLNYGQVMNRRATFVTLPDLANSSVPPSRVSSSSEHTPIVGSSMMRNNQPATAKRPRRVTKPRARKKSASAQRAQELPPSIDEFAMSNLGSDDLRQAFVSPADDERRTGASLSDISRHGLVDEDDAALSEVSSLRSGSCGGGTGHDDDYNGYMPESLTSIGLGRGEAPGHHMSYHGSGGGNHHPPQQFDGQFDRNYGDDAFSADGRRRSRNSREISSCQSSRHSSRNTSLFSGTHTPGDHSTDAGGRGGGGNRPQFQEYGPGGGDWRGGSSRSSSSSSSRSYYSPSTSRQSHDRRRGDDSSRYHPPQQDYSVASSRDGGGSGARHQDRGVPSATTSREQEVALLQCDNYFHSKRAREAADDLLRLQVRGCILQGGRGFAS
jgi:hypothetical protein